MRGPLENLRPWKPGQSGNPGGRPKRQPITDDYLALHDKPIPAKIRDKIAQSLGEELPEGLTYGQALAIRQYLAAAIEGDTAAAREIADRIQGKSPANFTIQSNITQQSPAIAALDNLTDEELEDLDRITAKAETALEQPGSTGEAG